MDFRGHSNGSIWPWTLKHTVLTMPNSFLHLSSHKTVHSFHYQFKSAKSIPHLNQIWGRWAPSSPSPSLKLSYMFLEFSDETGRYRVNVLIPERNRQERGCGVSQAHPQSSGKFKHIHLNLGWELDPRASGGLIPVTIPPPPPIFKISYLGFFHFDLDTGWPYRSVVTGTSTTWELSE